MMGLHAMNFPFSGKFIAACIAFHCSHFYISNPGSVSHFAKIWVSLLILLYIYIYIYYYILALYTCHVFI